MTPFTDFGLTVSVIFLASLTTTSTSPTQTLLYLYTQNDPNAQHSLTTTTNLIAEIPGYCAVCTSYLIVHGWQSSTSTWMSSLKDELFKNNSNINVFIVNWAFGSDITTSSVNDMFGYETSIRFINVTVREIWDYVGYYVNNGWIVKTSTTIGIHCIGHSLGAHVCGLTGNLVKKRTGGLKFQQISGLDPAGPCFDTYAASNRLDKEDADYVSVIHTLVLIYCLFLFGFPALLFGFPTFFCLDFRHFLFLFGFPRFGNFRSTIQTKNSFCLDFRLFGFFFNFGLDFRFSPYLQWSSFNGFLTF
jgi:hypothetical protein